MKKLISIVLIALLIDTPVANADRKFSGSIQIVIDLLDDLLMAGSIYLDEEE